MLCRKLCIGRRSRKECPRRCAAGQVPGCLAPRHLKKESSRFLFYGGDPASTEFTRGMKNRMAAGGSSAAILLRRPRGEASSICFKTEAAISEERWRR